MNNGAIGVFDSGLGGLTTLYECQKLLPHEQFFYLADSLNLPYGNKSDQQIKERVLECVRLLYCRGVKAVVVACNTATNAGIRQVRNLYDLEFVGLEPALKPATRLCEDKSVILLCTAATASGEKLAILQEKLCAKNAVILPQKTLAARIEDAIYNQVKNCENKLCAVYNLYKDGSLDISSQLESYVQNMLKIECDYSVIVLGCTHYIFIKQLIKSMAKIGTHVVDGNEGAARRLAWLLEQKQLLADKNNNGGVVFLPPPKRVL